MQRNKGFGLVEFSIIIVSASIILMVGISAYPAYINKAEIHKAKELVQLYRSVSQRYYEYHCDDAAFVQPTLGSLVAEGLISSSVDTDLSFMGAPTFNINRMVSPPTYSFSMSINAGESEAKYQLLLDPDAFAGSVLTWSGMINIERNYDYQSIRRFRKFYSQTGGC